MGKNYYYLHMKEDEGGTAFSPESNDIEFLEDLNGSQELPFTFTLKDGSFQDYLLNDLVWPMFSNKFKNIINKFLCNQKVQWVIAKVEDINNHQHIANILMFNEKQDVLDESKTIFAANNFIVKGVLSKEKVKNLDVFIIPDSDFQIVVSQDVKSEIENNNLTGVYFSKVPIA